MYSKTNTHLLRKDLRRYLDHLMTSGQRLLITRHGKPIAALVSPQDLEALEKVENTREALFRARQDAQLREFQEMKDALDGCNEYR